MSYQVLARAWRPRSFSSLVGQEHVVRALTHALNENRLHHAYLFTGTRGVGKTTLARILAKALNCEAGISAAPCGHCSACEEIDSGRFVDLIEVDAATNTKADEMRQLLENAIYAPTRGRFKVYVIDEVHMLSNHAFNAMLKTLEEPPEHVKFVLATTDPQKLPVTVLSRCLQFNLKQMPHDAISTHLTRILQTENIAFEAEALHALSRAASGSMRDALSLLDQAIAHGAGKVMAADVRAMLGTVDSAALLEILKALHERNAERMLAISRDLEMKSLSASHALTELALLLTRIQIAQLVPAPEDAEDEESRALNSLAEQFEPEYVQLAYQIVTQGRAELTLAPDEHSGFLMVLLRLLAFSPTKEGARLDISRARPPASTSREPNPSALNAAPAVPPRLAENHAPKKDSVSSVSLSDAVIGGKPAEKEEPPSEWQTILSALNLTALTRQLAQNCELVSHTDTEYILRLDPAKKAGLLRETTQENLRLALAAHFGVPIQLKIEFDTPKHLTPAECAAQEKSRLRDEARAAIENDPFTRTMLEEFGAEINEASITPL
ncbi:MAG: DNA polymerase III subunit gamma/tau [Zoogloeaceae bacterium]|jgi:DNA polymerase-3 subunit gamma/tau|nr:DNA polymerase III subunit gamma/tau [Zoogloeaceae bacterium]